MWFEILPAAFIIGGAIAFPGLCVMVMNKLIYGNIYNRDLTFPLDRRYYLRDKRLSNNPYKQFGLETIEDHDKPGGGSNGICKIDSIMESHSSPSQDLYPLSSNNNNSNPPPQDCKPKDEKVQPSVPIKKGKPDEPKKKKTDSQLELKKDIILGSAGHGGPASTRETNYNKPISEENLPDSTR